MIIADEMTTLPRAIWWTRDRWVLPEAPARIHQHAVEPDSALGSPKMAPAFLRYLEGSRTATTWERITDIGAPFPYRLTVGPNGCGPRGSRRSAMEPEEPALPPDELAAIRQRDARAVHGDDMDPDHMQAITDRGRLLEYIDEMQARGTA